MTEKLPARWVVIALVVAASAAALVLNWKPGEGPLNLGIDLRGGWQITYEIPASVLKELEAAGDSADTAVDETLSVMSTRIDTLGVRDISVRRVGSNRIQIQAPNLSEAESAEIKQRIVSLGKLEFLIGVGARAAGSPSENVEVISDNGGRTSYSFSEAVADAQREEAITRDRSVEGGYRDGRPYQLLDDQRKPLPIHWFRFSQNSTREQLAREGRIVTVSDIRVAVAKAERGEDYDRGLVRGCWMYSDPNYFGAGKVGFTGLDIEKPRRDQDRQGFRAVTYKVRSARQNEFEDYTSRYVGRPMALVLNDEVWSTPRINEALSDNVQISGGSAGFAKEDQDFLITCLQSGSLKLKPQLASEIRIAATLGQDAIDRGTLASLLGLLITVVFMVFYYRYGGLLATLALAVNLFLIAALLALFQATLTLPGIAGIVLTIGMSVDANILIFERIREELAKGKTLLAASQAGYERAFVTILDANVTTLLTAAILYWQGVGPIKGFAVTLAMGIITSMFTAVFFTRTITGSLLAKGWLKTFTMRRAFDPNLRIDFLGKRRVAVPASILVVALSVLIFLVTPGFKKYGLDFTGGASVRMNLTAATPVKAVRESLSNIVDAAGVRMFPQVDAVGLVEAAEGDGFRSFEIKLQTIAANSEASVSAYSRPILAACVEQARGTSTTVNQVALDTETRDWSIEFQSTPALDLHVLESALERYQDAYGRFPFASVVPAALDGTPDEDGKVSATRWRVTLSDNLLSATAVVPAISEAFAGKLLPDGKAFAKLDYIGPNVVSDLKVTAVVAIILSLVMSMLYLWFRFHDAKYGIAAAVAVFHDVAVALGVVVLVNSLGIVNVPLDLPIIAAFLTIIGYSLNDTIVIFDRVRENVGNIQGSLAEVMNISINQTLSRTIFTSLTTIMVVFLLYVVNIGTESAIEGIAFTLMIGIIVGTYSTIYIASPVVIGLTARQERKAAEAAKAR